jgi:acetoacetyl-CoA reductase
MNKKIALVTGGTGGIGTAICQKLSTHFYVVANYFKEQDHERALEWQQRQEQNGFHIEVLYGDIRLIEDCQQMVSLMQERYGQVDVLINNAGTTADATLKNMSKQQWDMVIDTNLNSVFNITSQVLPVMLNQKYGRIISISSINGRKGQFGQCNYAATKSALYGFSKSLAQEVASKGITVNTISPGYIETPMLAKMKPEILQQIVSGIPVGRLGKPEEIAELVYFLSKESSAFITGANIDINGGQYYG